MINARIRRIRARRLMTVHEVDCHGDITEGDVGCKSCQNENKTSNVTICDRDEATFAKVNVAKRNQDRKKAIRAQGGCLGTKSRRKT